MDRLGDRDRPLLHRFKQRRLRLGRGAIDLVGQHKIGKDRTRLEAKLLAAVFVLGDDRRADDIGRHQVGRELDARKPAVDHIGQRAYQRGLGQPRHAFQQRVAACKQRHQRQPDQLALPDDHFADLAFDGLGCGAKLFWS